MPFFKAKSVRGGFGLLHWRGQYIPSASAGPIEQHSFLVIGSADDSGNLKGFLRKIGRKFNQDAVVWKGYYRDVLLFALRACLPWGWLMATCKISDGFVRSTSPDIMR